MSPERTKGNVMSDAEHGGAGIVMMVGVNNNKNNKFEIVAFIVSQ